MLPDSPPPASGFFRELILRMHLCLRLSSASGTVVVAAIVRRHAILHPVLQGRGPVVACGRVVPFLHLLCCGTPILVDVCDRALVRRLSGEKNWLVQKKLETLQVF